MKRKEEAYCRWERDVFEGQEMLMEAIVLLLEATNSSKIKIAFWFLKNQNGVSLYIYIYIYIVGEKKANWKREEYERDDEPTANCPREMEERNFSHTHVTLFCPQPINHLTVFFFFFFKENFGKFTNCELPWIVL